MPDGEAPDAVYLGLHDPRAKSGDEENPVTGYAPLRPGEAWSVTLEVPLGTPPGQYGVYAGCFANDPQRPERGSVSFHAFPGDQFEVVAS